MASTHVAAKRRLSTRTQHARSMVKRRATSLSRKTGIPAAVFITLGGLELRRETPAQFFERVRRSKDARAAGLRTLAPTPSLPVDTTGC